MTVKIWSGLVRRNSIQIFQVLASGIVSQLRILYGDLTQVPRLPHGHEAGLEISTGALGGFEFLMRVDAMHRHVVFTHN